MRALHFQTPRQQSYLVPMQCQVQTKSGRVAKGGTRVEGFLLICSLVPLYRAYLDCKPY